MIKQLLEHHVLVNLAFLVTLVMGLLAYQNMPRQQDPSINFNWIQITTILPGAAASDVEKQVTDPLEQAIRRVSDIRFVQSSSREAVSNILVRFNEIDDQTFAKRTIDLRREVLNKADDQLPEEASTPFIFEITTANAWPTAVVALTGAAQDANLRKQARHIVKNLERLKGVDQVFRVGLYDPEIIIEFYPQRLHGLGITPTRIADTIIQQFRDTTAGTVTVGERDWVVRMQGSTVDPQDIARMAIAGTDGELLIGDVAEVYFGHAPPDDAARFEGRDAVILNITKKGAANTLAILDRVNRFIAERNQYTDQTGVRLDLVDDSTVPTRTAISIMQRNALIGLTLVLVITWLFLGSRIALLTSIGIPFILAGTFWILQAMGETLNTSVLLGVVIVLGMLVDDAVVVVEAIYHRLNQGMDAINAALGALREVGAPVVSAVLTTMSAFLPLLLLPGILGKFMFVIPLVVTLALAISLIEAFWMLPAHITALKVNFKRPSRIHRLRVKYVHLLQVWYAQALIKVLRYPLSALAIFTVGFVLSLYMGFASDHIRKDFFVFDPLRLFYVNVEMRPGTTLESTLETIARLETVVRQHVRDGEVRGIASYAGQMITETEPLLGDNLGQIFVSLQPRTGDMRDVTAVVDAMRADLAAYPGPANVSFQIMTGGPPAEKPIKVKVLGDKFADIERAAEAVKAILADMDGPYDISDDARPGSMELNLRLDQDALRRAGLDAREVSRLLMLHGDGELVARTQHEGEEVEVRVRARQRPLQSINGLLAVPVGLADGSSIALGELLHHDTRAGRDNILHYNYLRAVTVEAEIDKHKLNVVEANKRLRERWQSIQAEHPGIELNFSGTLDDVNEAIDALIPLFVFGMGLMYLVLGTQFRSYLQPFLILFASLPAAFIGVVVGLLVTGNPASLYTMYGFVALTGIAVNAAIVLITAANQRQAQGMTLLHATIYAGRRRVIPVIITTLTTIAGLFSLAAGIGGQSLIWGPLATAIVYGLAFSSVITLFIVPMLYRLQLMTRLLNWGYGKLARRHIDA